MIVRIFVVVIGCVFLSNTCLNIYCSNEVLSCEQEGVIKKKKKKKWYKKLLRALEKYALSILQKELPRLIEKIVKFIQSDIDCESFNQASVEFNQYCEQLRGILCELQKEMKHQGKDFMSLYPLINKVITSEKDDIIYDIVKNEESIQLLCEEITFAACELVNVDVKKDVIETYNRFMREVDTNEE